MKYSIHSQDPRYPTAQRVNPVVSGFLVISQEEVVDLLNAKDERIAELEASRKELIEEFAEAECMGDLGKIARNYGYIAKEGE